MNRRKYLFVFIIVALLPLSAWPAGGSATKVRNGVQLEAGEMMLQAQFTSANTVHISKWMRGITRDSSSLVVVQTRLPELNIVVDETDSDVTVGSERLRITISKVDATIAFLTRGNNLILIEKEKAEIIPTAVKDEKGFSIRQTFTITPGEAIYGLGQHQYGYMNYRGRTVKLVQTNTDAVTPFLLSTNNYGILWDNYSKTIFSDDASGASLWSDVASGIEYYLISGATMDSVIAGYRDLTGRAPMYGRWAYGYWQSKEHYENRAELMSVVSEYRRRRIPIDNIIQDWDYWATGADWGQLFFDEKKYPAPAEMIDSIHRQNYHIMISIWPGLGPNTPVYKEMQSRGFLYTPVGWGGFRYYDAYNPEANDIYWKHAGKGLFSKGIDGWWMDSTEPDVINALTKESEEYEMKRMGKNYLGSFARYLNPYSLLMTESVYKNQRKETDRKRVYILTRSTFAGQQRAAATTWSGDIGADWSIYKHQIAAGLNHSMSGIPYWTFDIGAFVIGSYEGVFSYGGKDPAYQELYTRMFQFGTFCPIFRSHGSETPREIWEFGKFSPVLEKFDNLRYRLMPYIYSLAYKVTGDGYTIMRGLAMDFEKDTKTFSIDDQFMFGPSLMVCPVTGYMLHRPPGKSIPVGAEHFRTKDGRPGLNAQYFNDAAYKNCTLEKIDSTIDIFWYTGRPDYVTDSTLSTRWEGKLVPTQTGKHQFHIKCFGPRHIYLEGKELPFVYQSVEAYTDTVNLQAGKEYDFKVETENTSSGALRVQLFWKTPEIFADEKKVETREQTRSVYLPDGAEWYDFWTGAKFRGGHTIIADAPIDKIPLLVREGSIIPMGPFVQYAAEKLADPIEVRVYPGADGSFALYEDENDNYNYEKGACAIIAFRWDDAGRKLVIGKREGSFPGMIDERDFKIVIVGEGKGCGIDTTPSPDRILHYRGDGVVCQF